MCFNKTIGDVYEVWFHVFLISKIEDKGLLKKIMFLKFIKQLIAKYICDSGWHIPLNVPVQNQRLI